MHKAKETDFFLETKQSLNFSLKKICNIKMGLFYLKKSGKKKVKEFWENHGALWGITTCYYSWQLDMRALPHTALVLESLRANYRKNSYMETAEEEEGRVK